MFTNLSNKFFITEGSLTSRKELALMAHLMRRAGFGASRREIDERAQKGYEATVEELVDPGSHGISPLHEGIFYRHYQGIENPGNPLNMRGNFLYRMINSPRPLEEKTTLFWHQVFATGYSKVDNGNELLHQIDMFRKYGMDSYKELLVKLAKNPAMIFWLDNNENHKHAPNENWGRELLELFTMGQGHYSEEDVKECSRAFTGWTIGQKLPRMPYGRFLWEFEYRADDHDDGEKQFLGHSGNFNGEDIIDIIIDQPATSRFLARHLYNFFVEDDVQVPSWLDVSPTNPDAIDAIADTLVDNQFDIRSTLRFIFNSDFFKDEKVWFRRVKSPAELIVGTLKVVEDYHSPKPGLYEIAEECGFQGQALLDPPSVEGWHTGKEWIDSGALLRRINFVADRVCNKDLPGVRSIIEELCNKGDMTSRELLDECLDRMGILHLESETFDELIQHMNKGGVEDLIQTLQAESARADMITDVMRLIAATREYQFA